MPEYLAPGVYVEETSFRAKSIEGVSTTTTGFIGPARTGPTDLPPDIITSVGEFERVYGGRQQLWFKAEDAVTDLGPMNNYLWHAVRGFFEEGGKRLYIVRVFKPNGGNVLKADGGNPIVITTMKPNGLATGNLVTVSGVSGLAAANGIFKITVKNNTQFSLNGTNAAGTGEGGAWITDDGCDRTIFPAGASDPSRTITIRSRYPGDTGGTRVRLTAVLGQNLLSFDQPSQSNTVAGLQDNDVVWITRPGLTSPPTGIGHPYVAASSFNPLTKAWTWGFTSSHVSPADGPISVGLADLVAATDSVQVVTLTVTVTPLDGSTASRVWSKIPLDPSHQVAGTPDSLFDHFAATFTNPDDARSTPLVFERGQHLQSATGVDILELLLQADTALRSALNNPLSSDDDRSLDLVLTGGNDGQRPTASEYEGTADPATTVKTGLAAFEDIDDISIIAAPGATYDDPANGFSYRDDGLAIMSQLIIHATHMRYRIAVLDSFNDQSISEVRQTRAKFDTSYAAFYYPWVRVLDPLSDTQIFLPPSGFVCGIYARNDTNRAVYKAPANEVVNLAQGFEQLLNKAQQEVLNPEGINCFRFFPERGYRLWGARTMTSDPEWKYVNLRRYFAYLEHSIDKGTQFAVFEPNGDRLWANVRRTIESFLLSEWQSGALLGDKPEKAYFVRCDRTTMTQNDLDNGRLVCLIGVAPLRPAEFVIFRIGQFTADS
jgi:phage tail sheath protein FI